MLHCATSITKMHVRVAAQAKTNQREELLRRKTKTTENLLWFFLNEKNLYD
jgi:hypothetical protein